MSQTPDAPPAARGRTTLDDDGDPYLDVIRANTVVMTEVRDELREARAALAKSERFALALWTLAERFAAALWAISDRCTGDTQRHALLLLLGAGGGSAVPYLGAFLRALASGDPSHVQPPAP